MIPESFAVFKKIGFQSLIDFNRFNFAITCVLMMNDFKINALVLFPTFFIQTYFINDSEVSLIIELGWDTDAQKGGFYSIMI